MHYGSWLAALMLQYKGIVLSLMPLKIFLLPFSKNILSLLSTTSL